MTSIFTIVGRLYGRAVRSDAGKGAARAVDVARRTVVRETRLARMRLRAALIRKKFETHLALLGKRVYRLIKNGEDPEYNPQVLEIIEVLGIIEGEIAAAEAELRAVSDAPRE